MCTLSVNQSFLSVSTSSFVTLLVSRSLVQEAVATYIECHNLLKYQRQALYNQLRINAEGTYSSNMHHRVPAVLTASSASTFPKVKGASHAIKRHVKDDRNIVRRRTESPKCLEILPLKGWKPPPAGILRGSFSIWWRELSACR